MSHISQIGLIRQIVNKLNIKHINSQYGSIISAETSSVMTVTRHFTLSLTIDKHKSVIIGRVSPSQDIEFTGSHNIKLNINDSKLTVKLQSHINQYYNDADEHDHAPNILLILELIKRIKISQLYSVNINRYMVPPCVNLYCNRREFKISLSDNSEVSVYAATRHGFFQDKPFLILLSDPNLISKLQAYIYDR